MNCLAQVEPAVKWFKWSVGSVELDELFSYCNEIENLKGLLNTQKLSIKAFTNSCSVVLHNLFDLLHVVSNIHHS